MSENKAQENPVEILRGENCDFRHVPTTATDLHMLKVLNFAVPSKVVTICKAKWNQT